MRGVGGGGVFVFRIQEEEEEGKIISEKFLSSFLLSSHQLN
jgi:hypothetical protein